MRQQSMKWSYLCISLSSFHVDEFNLLSFSQAVYTVAESEGQVEVCVDSLVPVARDATATIISVPQSATGMYAHVTVYVTIDSLLYYSAFYISHLSFHIDGEDYIGGIFTVTLSMGMNQNCISIPIIDDSIQEEQIEVFQVFLNNVDPGVDSTASMATVEIFDDDGISFMI